MKRKLFNILTSVIFLMSAFMCSRPNHPPMPPYELDFLGEFGHHMPHGENHFEKIIHELNLSENQKEKVKKLRERRKVQVEEAMAKIKPLHNDLHNLLEKDPVDLKKVREKLIAISNVQLDLRMLHIEGRIEFESLLTPVQKVKLNAMHKDHMKKIRKHMDKEQSNWEQEGKQK